jgi:glucose/arabinose dehydrogenase
MQSKEEKKMDTFFRAFAVLSSLLLFASSLFALNVQLIPVVSGLSDPVLVTNAHDGTNRLFIVEHGGTIKVLPPGGGTPTIFLDITSKVLFSGELGLQGLAFHPQYPANPHFYVDYSRTGDGATVIAEYQVSTNPNVANGAERVLLVIPQPFPSHKGGMLAFGQDGYLYISTGDGSPQGDPDNRAQDINQLVGKILRIDVNTTNGPMPYSSPSTNPFFGSIPGADEIYAYGFRNPWRYSVDRVTGDLYVGDVGEDNREEVDIVTLGGNYGWRVWEGTFCTGRTPDPTCSAGGYTFPVLEYTHSLGRCAIIGGYVYRGAQGTLPAGSYVFADLCTGEIFLLQNGSMTVLLNTATFFDISAFGEDEAGEVYLVNLSGTISRIASQPDGQPLPLRFIPVTPCRIMDTRGGSGFTGAFGPPFISDNTFRTVPIPASSCGIPSTAKAYSLNATVVPQGSLGFLTLWPAGAAQPLVSTLNALDGQVTANAAIVPAGTNGGINAYVSGSTDLILDINGYFLDTTSGSALMFYPVTPCRVADTRNPDGTFGGPILISGATRSFPIASSACGIPPTAQAFVLNATVVPAGFLGYLTMWPTGAPQPLVSTLNAFDGQITANMAIVPAGTGGAVNAFVADTTHLILDITGYFAPPAAGGLSLFTLTPCRVVDTRNSGGPISGGTSRSFAVLSSGCGVPASAQAYSMNATVVPSGPLGYLTVWPTGIAQPLVSTLNALDGQITANALIVPAGTNAGVSAFVAGQTDLILDVSGYFLPSF